MPIQLGEQTHPRDGQKDEIGRHGNVRVVAQVYGMPYHEDGESHCKGAVKIAPAQIFMRKAHHHASSEIVCYNEYYHQHAGKYSEQ